MYVSQIFQYRVPSLKGSSIERTPPRNNINSWQQVQMYCA